MKSFKILNWIFDGKLWRLQHLGGHPEIGSLRGEPSGISGSNGIVPITIASQATVYSYSFGLKHGQAFGIWLQATSPGSLGTPKLQIQLEQAYRGPTTEGNSDTNYVIGDGVADIYSALNDTIAHVKTVSPVPMRRARLKITGLATNPSDTTLTAYLFQQELVA